MPGVSVPPIATKESEFTALKGSRPPAFPPFTQGRPARICTTEGYRVWLCHLPRFWSLLFPSAGLLMSHGKVWRTGRELLAQDQLPSMLSPSLHLRAGAGAAGLCSGVCPIPASSRPHHNWSRFPFLQSLWLSCARVSWWEASLSLLKQTRFLVSWLLCPVPREELYANLVAQSCQERRASPQPRYFECLIGWGPGAGNQIRPRRAACGGLLGTQGLMKGPLHLLPLPLRTLSLQEMKLGFLRGACGARALPAAAPVL